VGIGLSFFDSTEDLTKFLEKRLTEMKALFHSYSKKLDEARRRSNHSVTQGSSKQSKILKSASSGNTKQIQVDTFKVLMNPSPEYEASILDEAIRTIQEQIEALEKTQKQVIPLLKNGTRLAVIFMDDRPTAFMYYERIP
jgi:prefoldin subunit 5